MQRRAAALYVALFLVVAAGSWGFIATAQAPTVTVENPDHTVGNGSEFTVNGRTYTVTGVEAVSSGGGGHGGGGGGETLEATAEWTNDSALYTETWAHNATVSIDFSAEGNGTAGLNTTKIDRTEFRVLVENASPPTSVTLREVPGEETTLETTSDNETFVVLTNDRGSEVRIPIENYADENPRRVTDGNQTYVLLENAAGNNERIPADQYVPIDTVTFTEGQTLQYFGHEAEVADIATNDSTRFARLEWRAPRTNQLTLSDGAEVELGPDGNTQTFVVHFQSSDQAALTTDLKEYHHQVEQRNRFFERTSGVWGVGAISAVAAMLLIGLAYLPRKE